MRLDDDQRKVAGVRHLAGFFVMIPVAALEKLVRTVWSDDPATHFSYHGKGIRDEPSVRQMQKAMAIIQFKLERRLIARNLDVHLNTETFFIRSTVRPGLCQSTASAILFSIEIFRRLTGAILTFSTRRRGVHGATAALLPAKPDAARSNAVRRTQGRDASGARLQPHLSRLRPRR
jgi:Firmicute fructose-1,6-bisphosphatase